MPRTMTPNELLKFFGTQTAIAEFFGITQASVAEWFVRDQVPAGRQYEAQVRTAGRLVAIPPANAVPPAPTFCSDQ